MRNQQNRWGLKNTSYFYLLPSFIIVLILISGCGGSGTENDYPISFSVNSADPTVTINKIYTMNAGNIFHATSRSTIELVHRSQDVWFGRNGINFIR